MTGPCKSTWQSETQAHKSQPHKCNRSSDGDGRVLAVAQGRRASLTLVKPAPVKPVCSSHDTDH
eukprot:1865579-Rhodomonas_salina.2